MPGYLYILRKNSMSNKIQDNNHLKTICMNYLLYFRLFYRYIKDFNKDLNYFYYDFAFFSPYLFNYPQIGMSILIFILQIFNLNSKANKDLKKRDFHQ